MKENCVGNEINFHFLCSVCWNHFFSF